MKYINYIYTIGILAAVSIIYNKYKFHVQDDESFEQYELVKKYLLNESSLAQSKKPIIWIHMVYDVNARWWPSFGSRNTDDLNQPYQYLTIKSVIDKCGEDFNICLIDDETFSNIIPGWTIDLKVVADPIRSKIRQLALAKVLRSYGGMLVPSSFLCFQSLISMYETGTQGNMMFAGELIDRKSTSQQVNFFPTTKIMGCLKDCPIMTAYIGYLEELSGTDYTAESDFLGAYGRWCYARQQQGQVNIVTADQLGAKDQQGKPVTIERLLGNTFIDMPMNIQGLYIPAEEILLRTAYQWFARLSAKQALDTDTAIGKYLLVSNN